MTLISTYSLGCGIKDLWGFCAKILNYTAYYSLINVFHLISVPIWKFSNLQEILVHKKRRGGIEKAVAALLPLLYFAGMAEREGELLEFMTDQKEVGKLLKIVVMLGFGPTNHVVRNPQQNLGRFSNLN